MGHRASQRCGRISWLSVPCYRGCAGPGWHGCAHAPACAHYTAARSPVHSWGALAGPLAATESRAVRSCMRSSIHRHPPTHPPSHPPPPSATRPPTPPIPCPPALLLPCYCSTPTRQWCSPPSRSSSRTWRQDGPTPFLSFIILTNKVTKKEKTV